MPKFIMMPHDERHGTMPGYRKGCRCERCIDANRVYKRELRDANEWLDPKDERQGTNAGYAAGCRCQPCKDAQAKYQRDRRESASHGEGCDCIQCRIKRDLQRAQNERIR